MWQKHIYRTRSIEGFRVRVNSQRFTKPQGALFRCYLSLFWSQLVTCRGRNPAAQTPARRQVRRKGRTAGVGRPCRRRWGRGGGGAEVARCGEDGGESTANPRPVSACGGASACSLCGRREPGCSAQKPSGHFHRSPLPFTKQRVPWSRADTAFSFHKLFHFNSNVFDKQKNNRYRCGSEGVR